MAQIPLEHVLGLAFLLFGIGLLGMLVRRQVLFTLLSLEVMLNATGLMFVAASQRWSSPEATLMFVLLLTFAAVQLILGTALAIVLIQRRRSLTLLSAAWLKG